MLEPLGLALTVPVLIVISSLAGDEFHWKGVLINADRPDDRLLGDLRLGLEADDPGLAVRSSADADSLITRHRR